MSLSGPTVPCPAACLQLQNLVNNVSNGGFLVRELKTEEKYVKLKPVSQFKVFIPKTFTHYVLNQARSIAQPGETTC